MKELTQLKRKYTRYKVNLDIEYSFKKDIRIKAHLLDLSIKGAKIRMNHILEYDDVIYLYFIENKINIQFITAKVKYRIGNVIGVKFELSDNNFLFLEGYLKQYTKKDKLFCK